ncbi:DUF4058 family protein [Leptothoe spongobia TAU-MAC 1115]|uniref:DUF4058 family protein n=1 Tax=Leptothoe spongobia TAU-MAC 1115 TaxID=1967444 RepID=A0A947GJP6_9CYAN|nr:DUF4058 family protein [Leptothoe spongobia TAU-MAC 1115]
MPAPISTFPLPLQDTEPDPIVNLQNLLGDIYDQSGYDLDDLKNNCSFVLRCTY